jgi:hypothetical protein
MHEVVASALQNSLSDFKEIHVSESKQLLSPITTTDESMERR